MDMEKVIEGLRCIKGDLILCVDCAYSDGNGHGTYSCKAFCVNDAIALLKEQEGQVQQWTKEIADNQLAHAPNDWKEFMTLDEHLDYQYHKGIWDGLQIAWNIISEGR